MRTLDSRQRRGASAPAQHVKPPPRQLLRHVRAQGAQAQDTHRERTARLHLARLPRPARLRLRVPVKLTQVVQRRVQGVFCHLRRHTRIFHANNRQVRGNRTGGQNTVYPGAKRKDRLKRGLRAEELRGRLPHHRVVA